MRLDKYKIPREEARQGKYSSGWRGGITPLNEYIRSLFEYYTWKNDCLKRDNYQCQECSIESNLEVHHIKPFALPMQ